MLIQVETTQFFQNCAANDGLYFPNYVWFNTSSNLGVEMVPLTDTDMSKNQK